MILGTL